MLDESARLGRQERIAGLINTRMTGDQRVINFINFEDAIKDLSYFIYLSKGIFTNKIYHEISLKIYQIDKKRISHLRI